MSASRFTSISKDNAFTSPSKSGSIGDSSIADIEVTIYKEYSMANKFISEVD